MTFILEQKISLADQRILDIGCGAGILSESLASHHAKVTGIDASSACIAAAEAHMKTNTHLNRADLRYEHVSDTDLWSREHQGAFDGVVCMELLEHLDDPATMIKCIALLLREGGFCFFSTINRHLFAYFTVILAGEYAFGILPKGTHTYAQFIKPSELARSTRSVGIECLRYQGFTYQPLTRKAYCVASLASNYMVFAKKT